ncbi:MAG: DUF4810 domain-containing protein [Desulfobulbaceae bacterium]|nr:DUF4810 domain-containing protein [Desulfobulbaceae bacterium]
MRAKVITLIMFMAFGALGCVPSTKYHWGNYENSLYRYYKNPAEVEEMAEALAKIIEKGERDGKVPPGLCAEYGYLLFTTGNTGEAIAYFEKEKNIWPESSMLMDKMIATTKAADNKKSK